MSAIVLKEHPRTTILTDARTSVGLTKFIENQSGNHCLYRLGYRNVINKGIRLNLDGMETHLMIETSGHGAIKENYFLDDGAYMVMEVIIEMVRMKLEGSNEGIGSLIKDLEAPAEFVELWMNLLSKAKDVKEKSFEAIEKFWSYIEVGNWIHGEIVGLVMDVLPIRITLLQSMHTCIVIWNRAKVSDKEGEHGWVHMRESYHQILP